MPIRREIIDLRSSYLVRAKLTAPGVIVAQMADDFLLIHTRRGSVDAQDLRLIGWTQAQIDSFGTQAADAALVREVRQSEPAKKPRTKAA